MKKAIVITPTTGAKEVKDANLSVLAQDYPELVHLLVVDGLKFEENFKATGIKPDNEKTFICQLPFNTGHIKEFYGHRVFAAFAYLTDFDYIFFLDQDNWFDKNHVSSMIELLESKNYGFVYSLRKIVDKDNKYICNDDCESLGKWPIWNNNQDYLIDTSCYGFTSKFLIQTASLFYWGWGGDRHYLSEVRNSLKYDNYKGTGLYTLNYRLGGNDGSVMSEFFEQGNRAMRYRYNTIDEFPWTKI